MKHRPVRVTALLLALVLLLPFLSRQGALKARAATVMDTSTFVAKMVDIAENYKTLYVNGGWGWPMNPENQQRAIDRWSYNAQPERAEMIRAADSDTFGFDCICVIKAVLWGWTGDVNQANGGAVYKANGVADFSTRNAADYCHDVSTVFDLDTMVPGELLLMDGHAGVYIGAGRVVECTPSWSNDVQITEIDSAGTRSKNGVTGGKWVKHGKLNYINYEEGAVHRHDASCGWGAGFCEVQKIWRPNTVSRLLYRDDGSLVTPGVYRCETDTAAWDGRPYELENESNHAVTIPAGTEAEMLSALKNAFGETWYRLQVGEKLYYLHSFDLALVEAAPSALYINIGKNDAPAGPLPYGKAFGCGGKITSNYPITEVTGRIVIYTQAIPNGKTVCSYETNPNATSYFIEKSGLDNAMTFNKLAMGTYSYHVTAKDVSGQTRSFSAVFAINKNGTGGKVYVVAYDANGGSPTPDQRQKDEGVALNLSDTVPVRAGFHFDGWNTKPDGSGRTYAPGALFEEDVNTTLFALWSRETEPPVVPITEPEIMWGDANGDGEINNKDVVRLKNYIANFDEETGASTVELDPGGDANGDGKINNKDIVRLKNYLANFDEETGTSTVTLGAAV